MNKEITKIDIVELIMSKDFSSSTYKEEVAPILEKVYSSFDSEELAMYYNELMKLYSRDNNKV